MASNGVIKQFFIDLLSTVGLAMGGGQAAARPELQQLQNDAYKGLQTVPLSPADAIEVAVKGAAQREAMRDEAALSGLAGSRFDLMYEATGNPPGPGELLEMLRRGIIEDADFDRGILQGLTRNDWIEQLRALRSQPLTLADIVEATVQGHAQKEDLHRIAGFFGVAPGDADVLYETAGTPLSRTEMEELVNRGEATVDELAQAIRESRTKDKYIPKALLLRRRIPPERSIVMLVAHGALSQADGVAKLTQLGFNADDATVLVQEGLNRKHAKSRDLSLSIVQRLYQAQVIPRDQAAHLIAVLGYTDGEAGWLLDLEDLQRAEKYETAAIGRVHSLYVGHHIEGEAASSALDGLHLAATQRDQLIHLWDLERAANVKTLTLAELTRMAKKNIIDAPTYVARVQKLGYTEADATLLGMDAGVVPIPGATP